MSIAFRLKSRCRTILDILRVIRITESCICSRRSEFGARKLIRALRVKHLRFWLVLVNSSGTAVLDGYLRTGMAGLA